ncbi:hypothetical protein RJ640_001654 [Escallonia rubra]|uniref:Uncharacterized protein n=1 Tax=Escallonia rubra TaxID=112253 RepID=A0AA88URN1_9ASTE|nr:hypothetical protein RJ640_001654 [Escallonia rubra]
MGIQCSQFLPFSACAMNPRGDAPQGFARTEASSSGLSQAAITLEDEPLPDGRTPLHLAVMKGRGDVIKELILAQEQVTRDCWNWVVILRMYKITMATPFYTLQLP